MPNGLPPLGRSRPVGAARALSDQGGERAGTRTQDPLIKSQMLYRLSYALLGGVQIGC